MPRTNLSDILKDGTSFEIRDLNSNENEFECIVKSVKKERERISRRKEVNWTDLSRIILKNVHPSEKK